MFGLFRTKIESRTDSSKCVSPRCIHAGQDFWYIWWLLKEPFFMSQSLFMLWVSSRSSSEEVQPGCWEEHLPVRW